MADDRNNRGEQDRSRVNGSEDYEIQYITEKLNVSAEQVREAIERVGNSREKIEEYLKSK